MEEQIEINEMGEIDSAAEDEQPSEFEDLGGDSSPNKIWLPETEGEVLEGDVILADEGDYGKYVEIQTSDDTIKQTPAHKILQIQLDNPNKGVVCVGDYLKITYKGLGKKSGAKSAPRIYKVERKVKKKQKPVEE